MPIKLPTLGNKNNKYDTLQGWIDAEKGAGYDLGGYIEKYGVPDQSQGQHLTDEFKLPHHITFSSESKYSTPETPGGEWKKENNKWHFYASDYNVKVHGEKGLQDYFNNSEKNSVLHLPQKTFEESFDEAIKNLDLSGGQQ